jgi:UDP-N-acetylmuramate dehydrogenase
MQVKQNISLKPYNTFGIDVKATHFAEISTVEDLGYVYRNYSPGKILILGGGSNVLFTGDFDGIVVRNLIKGIKVTGEDENFVYVKSGAGEVWHELVMFCIKNNFAGIENLSLIPGSVGAGPMQNIGAYGVEIKSVFYELEALNIETGVTETFSIDDCEFGYRESIFKHRYKNKYVIISVTLRLRKIPLFNISYGAIETELKRMGIEKLSIKAISDAVINIRRTKLPDPKEIGNSGSFFKNPEVSLEKFTILKESFPAIIGFPLEDSSKVKLAAGWLIEQCGWKGKRIGNTGAHKDQALVLVNYGNATGNEVYNLAMQIRQSVIEKFDVWLEPEVNII